VVKLVVNIICLLKLQLLINCKTDLLVVSARLFSTLASGKYFPDFFAILSRNVGHFVRGHPQVTIHNELIVADDTSCH